MKVRDLKLKHLALAFSCATKRLKVHVDLHFEMFLNQSI